MEQPQMLFIIYYANCTCRITAATQHQYVRFCI
jgi:hypothetical protein